MTFDDLRKLGYIRQADGSYSRPDSREARPARLSHAVPQPAPGETLDRPQPRKEKGSGRTLVRITRCAPRLLDADNFVGGCKPLIDQLRYHGLIADDDPASIELQFRQKAVRGKGWTEVEILPCPLDNPANNQ